MSESRLAHHSPSRSSRLRRRVRDRRAAQQGTGMGEMRKELAEAVKKPFTNRRTKATAIKTEEAETIGKAIALAVLLRGAIARDYRSREIGAAITPSGGQIETEKNVKYVPHGVRRNSCTIAQRNGDCSAKPGTVIRVEQQPSNGKVEVVPGEGSDFTFPVGNSRAHCNGKKVTGLNLSYQSSPKFVGEDEFTVMVLWPDGNASR